MEWNAGGVPKRVGLASMLRNRQATDEGAEGANPEPVEKDAAVQDAWVFTGSFMHVDEETGKRVYAGNMNGILVGICLIPAP